MSSALAMVLMAAMAVPGNGPEEMVSGEVDQWLDLRGQWKGVCYRHPGEKLTAHMCAGGMWLVSENFVLSPLAKFRVIDEGRGKMRIQFGDKTCLGIYKWEGSRVLICYSCPGYERPHCFEASRGQDLFILHRVKPAK